MRYSTIVFPALLACAIVASGRAAAPLKIGLVGLEVLSNRHLAGAAGGNDRTADVSRGRRREQAARRHAGALGGCPAPERRI